MFTQAQLTAELQTDPLALGYAAKFAANDLQGCADLINAATGPGATAINLVSATKGQILAGCIPFTDQLASGVGVNSAPLSAAITGKWNYRFQALQAGDATLYFAMIGPLLEQLVTDNLATTAQLAALTTRIGSRAEVLWGQGTIVTVYDIAAARS